ncbi:MAG: TonB-dependent receptor [Crocinitomicaceae bacterium]
MAIPKIYLIGGIAIAMYFNCYSQDTTMKHKKLEVVPVIEKAKQSEFITDISSSCPSYTLSKEKMIDLGTVDIGDAMRYVPGVQLKDYGGIGGIKTVSFRSLGAAHTSVSLDHYLQPNTQTGSINLSAFETFGMSQLQFTSGQPASMDAMPSAYVLANHIAVAASIMETDSVLRWKVYQNMSSIHAYESGVLCSVPIKKKAFIGFQGFGRYGSGQYPFVSTLSGDEEEQIRTNADLLSIKGRAVAGYRWKNASIAANFSYYKNDQLLPGAVILFNPFNDQELHQSNYRADVNYTLTKKDWHLRTTAFSQSNETDYYDPTFLNAQGFIRSNYQQQISAAGMMLSRKLKYRSERLFAGVDGTYSQLESDQFTARPKRMAVNTVVGISKWLGKWKVEGNLTHQFIQDVARSSDTLKTINYSKFSPYISIGVLPFDQQNIRFRFFYKRVFRMPTFNDLYYNFIGNTNLLPEDAQLFNGGGTWGKSFGKEQQQHRVELNVDAFYNRIKNKIVAIPTKDLFNWSMQNIGKTEVKGVEAGLAYQLKKNEWEYAVTTAHIFNVSIDITDPESPSYGHQIPYTPLYASTQSLSIAFKGYKITTNLLYTGKRYTLNENIPSNQLNAFTDWNIGVEKTFSFKKNRKLGIHLRMMNVLNKNYEVIRSFPMPGRYYQFTLNVGNL